MNATQDEEEIPQDEHMQDVEEVDCGGSEEETEEQLLHYELKRLDDELQKDKEKTSRKTSTTTTTTTTT